METREFTIHDQIENAVILCPHLNQSGIQVRTHGNRVKISGKVGSFFEKQMAQEAVRRVVGVEHIENDLQVKWKP